MLSIIRTSKLSSKPTTQTLRVLYLSNSHELAQHKLKVADGLHTNNFQMQNNSVIQNSYTSTLILKSKSSKLTPVSLSGTVNSVLTNSIGNLVSSRSIQVMMLRCARYVVLMAGGGNICSTATRMPLLEAHFRDQEGDGRTVLRWILERWVTEHWGGLDCWKIYSNGELLH